MRDEKFLHISSIFSLTIHTISATIETWSYEKNELNIFKLIEEWQQ